MISRLLKIERKFIAAEYLIASTNTHVYRKTIRAMAREVPR